MRKAVLIAGVSVALANASCTSCGPEDSAEAEKSKTDSATTDETTGEATKAGATTTNDSTGGTGATTFTNEGETGVTDADASDTVAKKSEDKKDDKPAKPKLKLRSYWTKVPDFVPKVMAGVYSALTRTLIGDAFVLLVYFVTYVLHFPYKIGMLIWTLHKNEPYESSTIWETEEKQEETDEMVPNPEFPDDPDKKIKKTITKTVVTEKHKKFAQPLESFGALLYDETLGKSTEKYQAEQLKKANEKIEGFDKNGNSSDYFTFFFGAAVFYKYMAKVLNRFFSDLGGAVTKGDMPDAETPEFKLGNFLVDLEPMMKFLDNIATSLNDCRVSVYKKIMKIPDEPKDEKYATERKTTYLLGVPMPKKPISSSELNFSGAMYFRMVIDFIMGLLFFHFLYLPTPSKSVTFSEESESNKTEMKTRRCAKSQALNQGGQKSGESENDTEKDNAGDNNTDNCSFQENAEEAIYNVATTLKNIIHDPIDSVKTGWNDFWGRMISARELWQHKRATLEGAVLNFAVAVGWPEVFRAGWEIIGGKDPKEETRDQLEWLQLLSQETVLKMLMTLDDDKDDKGFKFGSNVGQLAGSSISSFLKDRRDIKEKAEDLEKEAKKLGADSALVNGLFEWLKLEAGSGPLEKQKADLMLTASVLQRKYQKDLQTAAFKALEKNNVKAAAAGTWKKDENNVGNFVSDNSKTWLKAQERPILSAQSSAATGTPQEEGAALVPKTKTNLWELNGHETVNKDQIHDILKRFDVAVGKPPFGTDIMASSGFVTTDQQKAAYKSYKKDVCDHLTSEIEKTFANGKNYKNLEQLKKLLGTEARIKKLAEMTAATTASEKKKAKDELVKMIEDDLYVERFQKLKVIWYGLGYGLNSPGEETQKKIATTAIREYIEETQKKELTDSEFDEVLQILGRVRKSKNQFQNAFPNSDPAKEMARLLGGSPEEWNFEKFYDTNDKIDNEVLGKKMFIRELNKLRYDLQKQLYKNENGYTKYLEDELKKLDPIKTRTLQNNYKGLDQALSLMESQLEKLNQEPRPDLFEPKKEVPSMMGEVVDQQNAISSLVNFVAAVQKSAAEGNSGGS